MDLLTDFSQNSLLIASISCATFLILKLFAVIALKFVALGEYEKDEISSKLVSSVHAIIATLASAIILFLEVQTAWEQRASYASDRVVALVALSCGYFAYDLLWSLFDICTHFGLQSLLKFDAELMRNLPYLAHHLACFLVYSLCLQRKFYLIYVVFFLFWELSTPFLNLRWMLLKFSDAAASKSLRKVVDLTFALCFIGARNICGNWAMWYLWHDLLPLLSLHQTDKVFVVCMLACAFVLSALNTFWCWQIISSVIGGSSKRKESKNH